MSAAIETDSDRRPVICPVIGTLVNSGRLEVREDGRLGFDETRDALVGIGLSRALARLLVIASPLSNRGQVLRGWRTRSFDPFRMVNSLADHPGDTGIMGTGWFDAERFDAMLAMSTDGESLTMREMAAVIAADLQRSNGLLAFMTFIELGSLTNVFGYRDREGVQRISIAMLHSLYSDARLPEGWKPHGEFGVLSTLRTVWRLFRWLPDAPVVLVQGF